MDRRRNPSASLHKRITGKLIHRHDRCITKQSSKFNNLSNALTRRDYMKNPKKSGYRSYHMLVTTPVFLSDSIIDTKVEIQIRTVAQDFWATLEHKMHYKFEGDGPDYITKELRECARYVAELDERMQELNNAIQKYGKNLE